MLEAEEKAKKVRAKVTELCRGDRNLPLTQVQVDFAPFRPQLDAGAQVELNTVWNLALKDFRDVDIAH